MSKFENEINTEAIRTAALVIGSEIVDKKSLALKEIGKQCRDIVSGVDYLREQRKLLFDVPADRDWVIERAKNSIRGKREQVLKSLLLPELLAAQSKKGAPFMSPQWAQTMKTALTPEILFYLAVSENDLDQLAKELPPGGMTPDVEAKIRQIDEQMKAYAAELEELKKKAANA